MKKEFLPAALSGSIPATASKSEAHRLLICAGLTAGVTELSGFANSEDMSATINCLKTLGASFTFQGDTVKVSGGGAVRSGLPRMDCGESGSTLRFFVPIALALTGGGVFIMHGSLSSRPMDVYRDLFVPRGVSWHMDIGIDGAAELCLEGRLQPGDYRLPGNVSSQFISGLLFALPLLPEDSTLTVTGPVESSAYITMTLQALVDSGITIEETGAYSWRIPGGQTYQARSGRLHGDWSQAAVLLCGGALNGDVTVTGLDLNSIQGDRAVMDMLAKLGAQVTAVENGVRVQHGTLRGAELDMRNCPDIAPVMALVCQLAEGDSRLTGCARLRMKESDRLKTTVAMLNKLGGNARVKDDTIVLHGVPELHGGAVDVCRDHRMVMLASIAALRSGSPVIVDGVEALNKSWPDYLNAYASLGGRAE